MKSGLTMCKRIRTTVRNLSNKKHRDPDNQDLRLQYHEALKVYKQTLKAKKKSIQNNYFKQWKNQ